MIGFANIDTPFSLVDACLYVQLVDLKDRLTKDNTPGIKKIEKSYEQIYSDMRTCVDRCHKDGVIKDTVAKDPSKYITYDPNIFPMLDSFKKAGMKVFLLTNSLFDYTQVVMNYLEGRKTGENKDFKWTEYFDIIIYLNHFCLRIIQRYIHTTIQRQAQNSRPQKSRRPSQPRQPQRPLSRPRQLQQLLTWQP
jgi:hypothetical protein